MSVSQLSRQPAATPRVLLVNPFAGQVRPAAIARVVERIGLEGNAVLEIGKHGTVGEVAARLIHDGVRRVLVAGGDGTLHQVVQALAGTGTALGVIPLGTSNDLAQRLQVPLQLDRALDTLADARIARLDLLKMGEHRIATTGGFGVAAQVAAACNRLKATPRLRRPVRALGSHIYSLAAAYRILRHGAQAAPCTIRAGHQAPVTQQVSVILVSTVARFGGGLRLAPDRELRPGTFCALVVTATSRLALMDTLLRLKTGRSCAGRAQRHTGLTRLAFQSEALVGAFGDGEWLGLRHRAVVELEHGALLVMVPTSYRSTDAAASNVALARREGT